MDKALPIKAFVLPSIWANDDAMYVLMQPIRRPKHVDPEAYSQKVDFWSNLILDYLHSQRISVTSQKDLKTAFSRYFREEGIKMSPQCLSEVFEEFRKNGSVLPSTSTNDSAKQDEDELFVFTNVAYRTAEAFIDWFNSQYCDERLTDKFGPVYGIESFTSALERYFLHQPSQEYIQYLLTSVCNCVSVQHVTTADHTCTADVVRVSTGLRDKVDFVVNTATAKTESAVLAGLAQLRRTIKRQEQDERRLNEAIEEQRKQVKALVVQKRMAEAKRLLRRTKLMEQALDKKQSQLHNLESMQLQLETASDNQAVLRTLSDSSRVIRQTVDGMGGLSSVEETMQSISDSLQDTNEVSDIITSMAQTSLYDEDDLELELANLVGPAQKTTKPAVLGNQEATINLLPDVPLAPISTTIKDNESSSLPDQIDA